jgi:hypothetical protein
MMGAPLVQVVASTLPLWHIDAVSGGGVHSIRFDFSSQQISRIGARLLTRKVESQQREGVIVANFVNLWNSFGKAVCVQNV